MQSLTEHRTRYGMLASYRNDIIKFGLVNLLCIGIIALEIILNIELTSTIIGGIFFIASTIFFTSLLVKNIVIGGNTFIKRWELLFASIFVFAYTLNFSIAAMTIVELSVVLSVIYNLIFKIAIGLKIKLKFEELKWFDGGMIKK
jgi:hypothetical protein